jgi:hypothetical protein
MNAHGVLSASATAAPAVVRGGRRSSGVAGRKAVGVSSFSGNVRALRTKAAVPRAVAASAGLNIVAEKVVGIDLGTTNSAVSSRRGRAVHTRRQCGASSSGVFIAGSDGGGGRECANCQKTLRAQGLGGRRVWGCVGEVCVVW